MLENFSSISFNSRFRNKWGVEKRIPSGKSTGKWSKTIERKEKRKKKLNFKELKLLKHRFERFIDSSSLYPLILSLLLSSSLPMIDRRGRVYGPRTIEHNRETPSYAPKFVSTRYSRRGPSNTSGNTGGLSS